MKITKKINLIALLSLTLALFSSISPKTLVYGSDVKLIEMDEIEEQIKRIKQLQPIAEKMEGLKKTLLNAVTNNSLNGKLIQDCINANIGPAEIIALRESAVSLFFQYLQSIPGQATEWALSVQRTAGSSSQMDIGQFTQQFVSKSQKKISVYNNNHEDGRLLAQDINLIGKAILTDTKKLIITSLLQIAESKKNQLESAANALCYYDELNKINSRINDCQLSPELTYNQFLNHSLTITELQNQNANLKSKNPILNFVPDLLNYIQCNIFITLAANLKTFVEAMADDPNKPKQKELLLEKIKNIVDSDQLLKRFIVELANNKELKLGEINGDLGDYYTINILKNMDLSETDSRIETMCSESPVSQLKAMLQSAEQKLSEVKQEQNNKVKGGYERQWEDETPAGPKFLTAFSLVVGPVLLWKISSNWSKDKQNKEKNKGDLAAAAE